MYSFPTNNIESGHIFLYPKRFEILPVSIGWEMKAIVGVREAMI